MKKRVKVAITGAAGQIGYALVFRVASGQMFGPDTDVELSLLELPQALPALEGVIMELDDCAFPLLKKVSASAELKDAMRDVNWVLSIGAVPRKQGMERKDLLNINGQIFTAQGRAINDFAAKDVRVLIVGNPCNTNCLIAMKNAPDVPRDRFFAMTALDELRAKAQLAKKAGVDVDNVTQMTIWGNHSTTQYPDFFHAKINGRAASDVISDHAWLQGDFISVVQKRGGEVLKARGASSAASAANGVVSTVYHLTHDTAVGDSFSVSRCSEGEYGVDKDLIFSVPCRTAQGQLKVLLGIEHNEFGKEKLTATLKELREERDAVIGLKLINA